MVAISTDYNIHDTKNPLTHNRTKSCEKKLIQAKKMGYELLKKSHIDDYASLYNRSSLDIYVDKASVNHNPIDKRIKMAANGQVDKGLLFEYYNYCRYLFISSSREGGLPMNLQGIWNPLMLAPWRSNFHINVNIQEAYWFAEQANLSECHEPLFTLTENLVENGKETARIMFGIKRGSVAGHRTDAWFYSSPTFLKAHWGMSIVNAAWLSLHHMEHYRYTLDKEFLQTRALPVLKETALFFVDWLIPDPRSGKLVSGPTASPENRFKVNGKLCSLTHELLRMISWYVGTEKGFNFSLGKNYKFLDKHISKELWDNLLNTYSMSSYEEMWKSFDLCLCLFKKISKKVADSLGYNYPDYDENVTKYLETQKRISNKYLYGNRY